MRLIIGLGNPGEKYKNNRHNAGYMVIDELLKSLPEDVVAVKTDVFMNESGSVVKKLTEKYKVDPEDLYVIHDDLDIPLGSYKIQKGRGPKDHKGILSIERELETSDFWRVRVGIDSRGMDNELRTKGEDYVLQDFTDEELKKLRKVIKDLTKKFMA